MIDFDTPQDYSLGSTQSSKKTLFVFEQFGTEGFVSQINVRQNGELDTPKVIDPQELVQKLSEANAYSRNEDDLIDPRILVKSSRKLVWFYQPKPRQPLFYKLGASTFSKPIQWPTFVFKRTGTALSVCVIQNNSRPNNNTRVYHAPLPNVYKTGAICLGSCVLPLTNDVDALSEAYLNSIKTHLNYNNGLRHQPQLTDAKYFKWVKSKIKSPISVSELAPYGTLESFIKR
ncbi:hypothetical protein [Enterovibrio norvegicus]|uniref:hypothetical protein n=1 Tax=Enterovibrio norvegicus TaxID=188144 RepID=UPI0010557439